MDVTPDLSTCRYCRGTGLLVLLTSRVPCDCRLDREIEAALADAGLYLSVRTRKVVLSRLGLRTVRQLASTDPAEVASARSAHASTVAEIHTVLRQLGCATGRWAAPLLTLHPRPPRPLTSRR